MIAWVNLVVLLLSTLGVLVFYTKSAGPAALEKKIGPAAYARCTRYRFIASLFMGLACVNYVLYFFYPLPIPLPHLLKDEPAFKAVVDGHQRRLKELGDWRIFPLTVEMIAQGRFSLDDHNNVYVDGMPEPKGFRLEH